MTQGWFNLVLHAHLPFVRHPEREDALEERWLFEAITESYVPLLNVFQGLVKDGMDFRATVSLSPTLLTMLTDPLLQERFLRHIDRLIELAGKERKRTTGRPESEYHRLARMYGDRFTSVREFFLRYGGDLTVPFRELREGGKLELMTSTATHAFLPLIRREEAVRGQLLTAVHTFERIMGFRPKGIWLPECGFAPGLDRLVKECGLDYFFTDHHGLATAEPRPLFGGLSPVISPHGTAVFARDPAASEQVWSSEKGYPGDSDYREYYRDIGFDLELKHVGPYIHPEGIRVHTGMKYHRITGEGKEKEPYDPDRAREKAAEHAEHFLRERVRQAGKARERKGREPVITAPYDAELFGHWWYEGPVFLDMLFRKMHSDQEVIRPATPSEILARFTGLQKCRLFMSSWGRHGYADVWLREENDWIYPVLHRAEERMIHLADRAEHPAALERRALNQAARELMLAQASDWAFILDGKTVVEYALKRIKHHLNRFDRLADMVEMEKVEEGWLVKVEELDPVFPELDYRWFRSRHPVVHRRQEKGTPRLLMLSWEFPPMTVGGLSRHVFDLSRWLVKNGWEVHVITTEVEGYPHTETVEGVHVHRVHVMKPFGKEFQHWVFQLNLMVTDAVDTLVKSGLSFDLVHAHDWLVAPAAKAIKHRHRLPLIATIHATEHGRNGGIRTGLQRRIHGLERNLTEEACRVILCSQYMKEEARRLFELPDEKMRVVPNGVDPVMLRFSGAGKQKEPFALEDERIILFIGRLVPEKGVQTLLEAGEKILPAHPDVKLVIAGKGPMKEALEAEARNRGLGEKAMFTGFISDEDRNRLLNVADVTVFPSLYEPFGIVALEGMAAGTPVVVSDTGGLADVVDHGRTVLKSLPGDVDSLALQIQTLLSDPERARRMAESARAEVDRFDWNRIARRTIEIYGEALPSRRRTESRLAAPTAGEPR
ncbi:1,4-alpha-glucan branching enzyme [Melghirimyces profundicolus]|uniref:1,4-alpha-glucan branching enzyme n=1 Tax=Melghirimyces profundicolus TaxID=1242148 RepID=A0A2T6BH16_9BACL|nr:1,4-alpha-glucan branching protein domain-containing protein [Melghirimyces profundicolus]PTX55355.1 1,4-alpha-glucan branching enzyme [Melghirimyces profundicolus]